VMVCKLQTSVKRLMHTNPRNPAWEPPMKRGPDELSNRG
ncbi:unnamed protein product, partial [Allacma fusca]